MAPTAKAPGGWCIELTRVYTTGGPLLWAWDWCGSEPAGKTVSMNQSFISTYTATVNGRPAYTMDEAMTGANNTWTVYLYDYKTQTWDVFYTSSGTDKSGFSFGWDTYEVWSNTDPATNRGYFCENSVGDTIESSGIQLYTGSWTAANSTDAAASATPPPAGSSFDCPSLSLRFASANDWAATNP
ncbi:MAG TPA: hypothetical protein VGX23_22325 [Actinocrinis sp.]|nr:hypothetical protein [Actinocrinis sp.]